MEEVDRIIVHSLRSIGCDVEDDIQSLRQFGTELIIATVVQCLKVILGDIDLPSSLPPGMSARFRLGASLANHVQDLGYKGGDLGYQTFLYSNETEIRKIFMFLVEKLPKESSQAADEPIGASVLLQRAISTEINTQLSMAWLPSFLKDKGVRTRSKPPGWQIEGACCLQHYHSCPVFIPKSIGNISNKVPKELRSYYIKHLPYVTNQTNLHRDLAPSIMEANSLEVAVSQDWENEWNQIGLASRLSQQEFKKRKYEKLLKMIKDRLQQDSQLQEKIDSQTAISDLNQILTNIETQNKTGNVKTKGSRFAHTEKLQYAKDEEKTMSQIGPAVPEKDKDTEEELEKKRKEEVDSLRTELSSITAGLEKLELEVKKFSTGRQEMEEEMASQKKSIEEKNAAYKVKKRTLDLLPEAEANIEKLQQLVETSSQRLINLSKQWEAHRDPLIQQYNELSQLNSKRESEAEKKLEEIKLFRNKMKEVADDARRKEELHKQLVSEYERMTKDVNRSAYTRKILEIVANIKKQKQEIDKILVDTKSIQKEINSLTGKLDRTFTVTDELIFRDAKKDEAVKKAYRFLAALHENFEQLISTVEDTGVVMREIKDLEEQVEIESNKKVLSNLEKISVDLQQMKKENATLLAKVKGK
ncbi:coiled-coil domain-containing protein 22 homolog [Biomphalaria glabrata]|uniref:Coiled-coil domain-containing protein 22 homolog n=2 Tax=Biomphalaria glabrata TaxID=6526 RepID=A0A9W3B3P3_BIOGL|nr:coiled-coil domain-containing protein 22 homolog [Biomphalaria glabrata]